MEPFFHRGESINTDFRSANVCKEIQTTVFSFCQYFDFNIHSMVLQHAAMAITLSQPKHIRFNKIRFYKHKKTSTNLYKYFLYKDNTPLL